MVLLCPPEDVGKIQVVVKINNKVVHECSTSKIDKSCHLCYRVFGPFNDYAQLLPCNHLLCTECCFEYTINRKLASVLCGCCQCNVGRIKYHHGINLFGANDSGTEYELKDWSKSLDPKKEPYRYLKNEWDEARDKEAMKNRALLSFDYINPLTNDVDTTQVNLDLKNGFSNVDDYEEAENNKTNLVKIFRFLKRCIFTKERKQDEKKLSKTHALHWMDFVDVGFELADCLVLRLIHALTTGRRGINMQQVANGHVSFFSEYFACVLARCMMMRVNTDGPGPLQNLMSNTFDGCKVPTDTVGFFSKLRLCGSVSATRERNLNGSADSLARRITLEPGDLPTFNADNIGFKIKSGYVNFCLIQAAIIPVKKLKKVGFYTNDEEKRISRVRKTFPEILDEHDGDEEELANAVVGTDAVDNERLSNQILTHLKAVLLTKVPKYDDLKEILSALGKCPKNSKEALRQIREDLRSLPYKIPRNMGVALPEPNVEKSSKGTFYERNDISMDNIMRGDPAKKSVIRELANYAERISDISDLKYDEVELGGEKPLRGDIAPVICDGSPVYAFSRIRQDDIHEHGEDGRKNGEGNDTRLFKRTIFFPGGFHCFLQMIHARNLLTADFRRYFIKQWRKTTGQQDWVLKVSDPKDFEEELVQYVWAMYRAAADKLSEALGRDVSTQEVNKHMVNRAEKYPAVMLALVDLRMAELILMFRDSEKSGDVAAFVTAFKFAMHAWAATHATHYMYLGCDFLENLLLQSDADRILFKEFLFVKITPCGKFWWTDKGVEKNVGDVRVVEGKVGTSEEKQAAKLDRTVPKIPARKEAKRQLREFSKRMNSQSYTSGPWNDQKVHLSPVYAFTYVEVVDLNLWGTGTPKIDADIPRGESKKKHLSERMVLPDGSPISKEVLFFHSTGSIRGIDYYIHHKCQNRDAPAKRSEKVVKLTGLHVSKKDYKKRLRNEKLIQLSTNLGQLRDSSFTRDEIYQEICWLKENFYPGIPERLSSNSRRDDLLDALVKYRTLCWKEHTDEKDRIERSFKAEVRRDATSTPEERKAELKRPFYSLSENVLEKFHERVERN